MKEEKTNTTIIDAFNAYFDAKAGQEYSDESRFDCPSCNGVGVIESNISPSYFYPCDRCGGLGKIDTEAEAKKWFEDGMKAISSIQPERTYTEEEIRPLIDALENINKVFYLKDVGMDDQLRSMHLISEKALNQFKSK